MDERLAKMKGDLAATKAILDGVVLHPGDAEGHRMLAQQLESNRKLTELVEKVGSVLGGDEQTPPKN